MTVTVYSKPACVQCNATYRSLNKGKIEYDTVDLTTDAEAYSFVKEELGFVSAPVVVVRNEAGEITSKWSGFRPEKIASLTEGALAVA